MVHAHSRDLINGDHHRLSLLTPSHEMRHDILGDLFQPVIAGNQAILLHILAL